MLSHSLACWFDPTSQPDLSSCRPSSRPTSPCGKRRHSSADPYARRSPSPHHSPSPTPGASPRGSITEDTWLGSPAGILGPLLLSELDVPSKTRRRSGGQLGLLAAQGDPALESFQDGATAAAAEESHDQDGLADLFLHVPSNFSWNKPQPGNPPLFRCWSVCIWGKILFWHQYLWCPQAELLVTWLRRQKLSMSKTFCS